MRRQIIVSSSFLPAEQEHRHSGLLVSRLSSVLHCSRAVMTQAGQGSAPTKSAQGGCRYFGKPFVLLVPDVSSEKLDPISRAANSVAARTSFSNRFGSLRDLLLKPLDVFQRYLFEFDLSHCYCSTRCLVPTTMIAQGRIQGDISNLDVTPDKPFCVLLESPGVSSFKPISVLMRNDALLNFCDDLNVTRKVSAFRRS